MSPRRTPVAAEALPVEAVTPLFEMLSKQLTHLNESVDRIRESNHKLVNGATAIGLRTEMIEREVGGLSAKIEQALDDPAKSPMGRALLRDLTDHEERLEELETAVQGLIKQSMRAVALIAALAVIATVATTVANVGASLGLW